MSELKYFPKQVKIEVLYRIWAGERISEVAREQGISRQIIYTWKKKAELAVSQALEEKKKGPRFQKSSQRQESPEIQERKRELSRKAGKTQWKVETLEKENTLSQDNNKRPERCPVCGCQKIYKNGTYLKKNGGSSSKVEQVIQRYICVWCKSPVYLAK